MEIDSFTRSYLETALWSSIGDDGTSLDKNYTIEDLSEECIKKAIEDCNVFRQDNIYIENLKENDVAHDLWLTRNHHGCGFWDGDYEKEVGDYLTKLAHSFGEIDLYVGDDGKIYSS